MPGGGMTSIPMAVAFPLCFATYSAGFTALSGYCLHRVKCGSSRGADKMAAYAFACLPFLVSHAPLIFLYTLAESVFPFFFYAVMLGGLFVCLHYSPEQRRRRMYIPAAAVFSIIFLFGLVEGLSSYYAFENGKKANAAAALEFRAAMKDLLRPERHIQPPPMKNDGGKYDRVLLRIANRTVAVLVPGGFSFITHTPETAWGFPVFGILFFHPEREEYFLAAFEHGHRSDMAYFFTDTPYGRGNAWVPFIEEGIYQHFNSKRLADSALDIFEEFLPKGAYVRGLRPPHAMVQYTDSMVVSSFSETLDIRDGGKDSAADLSFLVSHFFLGKEPVKCLFAAGGKKSAADADMPQAWLNELRNLNAGAGSGGLPGKPESGGTGKMTAEEWLEAFLRKNAVEAVK